MAVIVDGEAEEFGAVRVDFDVVKGGERADEVVKVLSAVVVDAKVIYYQAKGDLAGVVAEEAGCGGFDIAVRKEVCGKAVAAEFAGIRQTIRGLNYFKIDVGLALIVSLDKRGQAQVIEGGGGVMSDDDFNEFGLVKLSP